MTKISPIDAPSPGGVPLVHKVCEFYKLFHFYLKKFPKQEQYTLGQKIENLTIEVLELSLTASFSDKTAKRQKLIKASEKVDLLKVLLRLAYETRSLNLKKYTQLAEKSIEIGKMIGGWLKSTY